MTTRKNMTTRKTMTLTLTGTIAAMIEKAIQSSFYGIRGDNAYCYNARRESNEKFKSQLARENIDWKSFFILDAKMIDTTGTKTPYKAIVIYSVEL